MSAAPIATLRHVRLSLGGSPLFSGVDLSLLRGERASLVGRNGAGKSTLMRILADELEPDDGEVWRQPGVRLHYLKQEPDFSSFSSAIDVAASDVADSARHRAEAELELAGLSPDLDPETLSGGQRRRLGLARAFAADPDILLLDEPTNHLDIAAIEALETRLKAFRGAILVVSHDRRFLENVTTSIAWLRQGAVRAFNKGYKHFEPLAEQVEEEEEKALSRLETKLKAENRWLARGVTGRRKRNMGRLRKLQTMRQERASLKAALNAGRNASLASDSGDLASKLVIETKALSKTFDTPNGPLPIVTGLDLKVMRGDRIGVMGGNGTGKTTLLRLLLKQLAPDDGRIRLAKNLDIAYLDQTRERLKPGDTMWETLAPLGGDHIMVRGASRHVAAYAKDFMFAPTQLRQPVGALSGGERNRLTLALALAQPSNLLVLDEPTNDLDVETLDMLEDMLSDYDGTLIIVSHDRAFMDGVVTSLLTPEGDGLWLETPGGYADYIAQKKPDRPAPSSKPSKPAETKTKSPKPATKLSYKDARRADMLDGLIPEREAEIARLEAELAVPDLFEKDPASFNAKAERLESAKAELEQYEIEWLDIEDKRERLAAGADP